MELLENPKANSSWWSVSRRVGAAAEGIRTIHMNSFDYGSFLTGMMRWYFLSSPSKLTRYEASGAKRYVSTISGETLSRVRPVPKLQVFNAEVYVTMRVSFRTSQLPLKTLQCKSLFGEKRDVETRRLESIEMLSIGWTANTSPVESGTFGSSYRKFPTTVSRGICAKPFNVNNRKTRDTAFIVLKIN